MFDAHTAAVLHGSAGALAFVLAVLAARLFEKKSEKSDLALILLVLFLGTVGTMQAMPGRLSVDDVRFIITCGSCALLGIAPPNRLPARVAVCAAAIVPLAVDALR